nr:uncharacterized protein LOC112940864 [Solanum lycopersicum]
MFKTTFLERFFPREIREAEVEEFINLKQVFLIVSEYSLKFVKLSRYATSLVCNNRNVMSRFLTGITGDLEEECRAAMFHHNMDLSRLVVHVQQVEDSRKKMGVREQPRFKKGHHSLGNSNFQRSAIPRGGRTEPKKGNGGDVQRPRKDCAKCGCAHSGECRQVTNACFGFGRNGHMVKECRQNRGQAGGNAQNRPNPQGAAATDPLKSNRFYALKGREEQEKSGDVVTCMLQVFSTSPYALFDPGSMLSFVTRLLALSFEILPEFLHDPIVEQSLP